jgi:hypothetical protein
MIRREPSRHPEMRPTVEFRRTGSYAQRSTPRTSSVEVGPQQQRDQPDRASVLDKGVGEDLVLIVHVYRNGELRLARVSSVS